MNKDLFYRYNPWWEGSFELIGVFDRPDVLEPMIKSLETKHVYFLTGLRRVGKTTLMRLMIKYLVENEKCPPRHIFYISLDDYLLAKNSIIEIIEAYRTFLKIPFDQKVFLFLDEITHKSDFELQLKNLFDGQNVKIFASSSSASLLKTGKPHLTGRNVIHEVMPLDFGEYLRFKKISILQRDAHLRDAYFEDFLKTGGIPEYVLFGIDDQLRELVDDIILKDIAALHGIKDTSVLKDLFLLLMERAGKVAGINKIANILSISPDTSRRYLSLFADTYLIYTMRRWGKTNARILAPQKVYAADLGIRTLFSGFRDKGSLFENYVYLKIRNKNPFYFYKDTIEIDFITEDKILLEAKYHSEMSEKQTKLFQEINAKRKTVIHSPMELDEFLGTGTIFAKPL
jgi:uncharacterized protein